MHTLSKFYMKYEVTDITHTKCKIPKKGKAQNTQLDLFLSKIEITHSHSKTPF